MTNWLKGFPLALGFLTRLAPARLAEPQALARAMAWLPAVGLVLGCIIILPFWLGLARGQTWVQAWLVVALSAFLTRGLHLDGLSDVLDGAASHADPERFWAIVKDSRIGTFGVAGLVLALLGQVILFEALLRGGNFGAVAWTFCLGRFAALSLGAVCRDLTRPGLGKTFISGADLPAVLLGLAVTAGSGLLLVPLAGHALALCLAALALVPLWLLARRVRGINGDFLGAAVVLGELAGGVGLVVAAL